MDLNGRLTLPPGEHRGSEWNQSALFFYFPFNLRNSKGHDNIETIHNVAKRLQKKKTRSNICCFKQVQNFNNLNRAAGRHRSAAPRYVEVANWGIVGVKYVTEL